MALVRPAAAVVECAVLAVACALLAVGCTGSPARTVAGEGGSTQPSDIAAVSETAAVDGPGLGGEPGAAGSASGGQPAASPVDAHASGPRIAAAVALDGPSYSLAGLDAADTVVEYPAGRTHTAALVIGRAQEGPIGPLRPAVTADATLASGRRAPLVAASLSDAGLRTARDLELTVIEEGVPPGVVLRDPARRAPFNAYALREVAAGNSGDDVGDAVSPWRVDLPPPGGDARDELQVDVAPAPLVAWAYRPRDGQWVRHVAGQPVLDVRGVPVTAGTVVVVEFADATKPVGAGPAVVARAGRRYAATWDRGSVREPMRLTGADGAAFPVEGTVWLHLCPQACLPLFEGAEQPSAAPGR